MDAKLNVSFMTEKYGSPLDISPPKQVPLDISHFDISHLDITPQALQSANPHIIKVLWYGGKWSGGAV